MSSTSPSSPAPAEGGFLAPRPGAQPGDHCVRCGKPTPPGVALCDVDNPARIPGPSATQMHATILGGIVVSAILFLLIATVAVGQGGPYTATITERALGAHGGPTIVVGVANTGDSSGVATCRVTRDGAPRPDDPTYRTDRIEPGAEVVFQRDVPAPPAATAPYDLERMSVICT